MVMTLFAVLIVGVSAYVWMTRGFFSAFIHLLCVIVAGAVAFGLWETLGYLLIDVAPERGFGSFLVDWSWGIALAVPFALTLALLRVGVDSLLPANALCGKVGDYVGGGLCGALSGVITAGIVVLSIGFLRLAPDFWGYQGVVYTTGMARGNVEATQSKFVPWVDRLTAGFYSQLSLTTLRTGSPMGVWQPEFATLPAAMRLAHEGTGRMTHKPEAAKVIGMYSVGDPKTGQGFSGLLADAWNSTPQKVADFRGEPIANGYIAGVLVTVNSAAREKAGFVAIGAGQARLVVQDAEGNESRVVHPIAVVTRVDDPTQVAYQRFRMEQDNFFASTIAATAEGTLAFEFPVPAGFTPIAIYVKGIRTDLSATKPTNYAGAAERDADIISGALAGMGGVGPIIDPNTGQPVAASTAASSIDNNPVQVTSSLFGINIMKGNEGGLEAVPVSGGRGGYMIRSGEAKFDPKRIQARVEPKLAINRFESTPDQAVVQVNFTPMQRSSIFGKSLDMAERTLPPYLVDSSGQLYEAVGFIYRDNKLVHVRFTKDTPIRAMQELPTVGRSDPTRSIQLVFVVSAGVELTELRIGNKAIEVFEKPVKVEAGR